MVQERSSQLFMFLHIPIIKNKREGKRNTYTIARYNFHKNIINKLLVAILVNKCYCYFCAAIVTNVTYLIEVVVVAAVAVVAAIIIMIVAS